MSTHDTCYDCGRKLPELRQIWPDKLIWDYCLVCQQRHLHLCYTDDPRYRRVQREHAKGLIEKYEKKYASSEFRIKELAWWCDAYWTFGNWMYAIDILEDKIVEYGGQRAYGKVEAHEKTR